MSLLQKKVRKSINLVQLFLGEKYLLLYSVIHQRGQFPIIILLRETTLKLIIASASADASAVGWRVTFKVVDTLTVRPQMAGRPFQEQPHELYRK